MKAINNPHTGEPDMVPTDEFLVTVPGTDPQRVPGPVVFGSETDHMALDAEGYQTLNGDAGGYVDIFFTHGVPKATGPGNPSLTTYLGNQRGYAYAVGDAHDFDPQEYYHQCEVGADFIWHLHFISRANDASDRTIRFELEASYLAPSGVETQLPLGTLDVTVPAGTLVNTSFVRNIMTSNVPGIGPVWILSARISRVAAAGTAPSVDPMIKALHIHAKVDTPQGSHTAMAK